MTAATQVSGRPTKPPRSKVIYAGIIAFVVITALSVSERWGIGLDLFGIAEDLGNGRDIIYQLLHPNWAFLPKVVDPLIETFQIAVVASFIGCGLALPISFLASRTTAPNRPTLTISRGILSVVRAIPDFLYALIFVAAIGIGALPGILALIFFDIGVVAKLLSETVDGVDDGPIEAVDAGGSSRTQMVRWAVLPQVLPNYVAFSLYEGRKQSQHVIPGCIGRAPSPPREPFELVLPVLCHRSLGIGRPLLSNPCPEFECPLEVRAWNASVPNA